MIKRMEDCGRVLTEADVRSVERELGVSLPDEYKSFLIRFNGGIPRPGAFPIRGMPNNSHSVIQEFFGIDRPIESSNLKWNYEVFSSDTPPNLFPIACTPSGDVVCLSLFGHDAGSVLLWDYYNAPRDPSSYDGIYLSGRSFNEFLESIFESPESPATGAST